MIGNLKNKFLFGSTVAAVHISVNKLNIQTIRLCQLRMKGNLIIPVLFRSLDSVSDIASVLKKDIPVCLTISGKGVISRIIEDNSEINVLNKILPNADVKDFFIQSLEFSEKSSFASAIRKSSLDEIIRNIEQLGLQIIYCSLNFNCITSILHLKNQDSINISGYSISIKDNSIVDIKTSDFDDQDIYAGDEKVSSEYVIAFASAMYFWTHLCGNPKDNRFSEYFYKRLLKVSVVSITVIVLMLLLVNYLLFTSAFKKNTELELDLYRNKELLNEVNELQKDLKIKENLFANADINGDTKFSQFADQLAACVPNSMNLTEMAVCSPKKDFKKNEKIEYYKNLIEIQGVVNDTKTLNLWIKEINKLPWVEQAEIDNYMQVSKNSKGEFVIKITFKE